MTHSRTVGTSMYRPFLLVYLMPLILGTAALVTLGTVFVSIYPVGPGPVGPSYGFPIPYKSSFCEILPCASEVNWAVFGLDVLFYTGLLFGLTVFYLARKGRLLRPPPFSQLLATNNLALAFQLTLLSGLFMAFVPPMIVPYSASTGVVCLVPSPCQSQQDYYSWAWYLMMSLWVFSGFITLFAGEMVGLVGDLSRRFMTGVLVSLAGIQISGIEVFLVSGVIGFLKLTAAQVTAIAITVTIGPLLLLASALLLVAKFAPIQSSASA